MENSQLFYFSDHAKKMYSLDAHDDSDLTAFLNEQYGINSSENLYKYLFQELRSYTVNSGECIDVRTFSHYDKSNNTIYLDNGNQEIIKINKSKVETIPNGSENIFFRDIKIDPIEVYSGKSSYSFSSLFSLPNFKGSNHLTVEQESMLFELWGYALFFIDLLPVKPVLLFTGAKGSGKTTAPRMLMQTLFGKNHDVTIMQANSHDGLIAALTTSHLVVLDNVDGKYPGIENILAAAATGGAITLRVLYTTNSKVNYPINCFIAVTSREPDSFSRDDVVDRLIILSCDRFKTFSSEKTMSDKYNSLRPKIWKNIINTLQKVLLQLEKSKPRKSPFRLADFYCFACDIAPAIGYTENDIKSAFDALEKEKGDFSLEGSSLLQAVSEWVDKKGLGNRKEIDTGVLYDEIKLMLPGLPYPRANEFGRAFKNSKHELSRYFYIKGPRPGPSNKSMWVIKARSSKSKLK